MTPTMMGGKKTRKRTRTRGWGLFMIMFMAKDGFRCRGECVPGDKQAAVVHKNLKVPMEMV